jgi:hypothetical protein
VRHRNRASGALRLIKISFRELCPKIPRAEHML